MLDLPLETKGFALDVIRLCENIGRRTYSVDYIRKQLTRAACSMAANYRAVCRSRSNKEFYAKISISVEEMDESLFWLEMLSDFCPKKDEIIILKKRAKVLLKVLSKSRRTVKMRL